MTELEEIKASVIEAAKKRKNRKYVQRVLDNLDEYSRRLRDELLSGSWQPPKHEEYILQEGYHKKARQVLKKKNQKLHETR